MEEDSIYEDSRIVEGFSNEALMVFTLLFATIILGIISCVKRRYVDAAVVHPDMLQDVQDFRDLFIRATASLPEDTRRRIEGARRDTDRTCPICYGTATFPILSNCGHTFCCECIHGYWRHSRSLVSPVNCAICRSPITVFLPLDWPPQDLENDALLENNIRINDYNRRFSGDRPWTEYLYDLPVLIPYLGHQFVGQNGLLFMFRLRVIVVVLFLFLYILSPFDILPEAVYGFMGFVDDVFVVVVIGIYLSIAVRHMLARRGEVPVQE